MDPLHLITKDIGRIRKALQYLHNKLRPVRRENQEKYFPRSF